MIPNTLVNLLQAAEPIQIGEIGVLPTDTLYGLCGSALNPKAVETIYRVKNRGKDKPVIVLIAGIEDIQKFDIALEAEMWANLLDFWSSERPTSVAIPASLHTGNKWRYLDRGTGSIAFRVPTNTELRDFLERAGPVVAPSANPEGMKPAQTIEEAMNYFGNTVDFYVDGGTLNGSPSRLVRIAKNGEIEELRK